MRKFVNKEGQVYWVTKDFELSIMEKEGYTEEVQKETKATKRKTEK